VRRRIAERREDVDRLRLVADIIDQGRDLAATDGGNRRRTGFLDELPDLVAERFPARTR